jgi:hypothetical protein
MHTLETKIEWEVKIYATNQIHGNQFIELNDEVCETNLFSLCQFYLQRHISKTNKNFILTLKFNGN